MVALAEDEEVHEDYLKALPLLKAAEVSEGEVVDSQEDVLVVAPAEMKVKVVVDSQVHLRVTGHA